MRMTTVENSMSCERRSGKLRGCFHKISYDELWRGRTPAMIWPWLKYEKNERIYTELGQPQSIRLKPPGPDHLMDGSRLHLVQH